MSSCASHNDADLVAIIAENLPDPVVWLDSTLQLRWANRAAERVFGWSRDEMVGDADVLALLHPDDLNVALTSTVTVADKDVGTLVDLRIRTTGDTWQRVEVRGRSVTAPDGDQGLLLVLRDTDDRHGWDLAAGDTELLRVVIEAASTPVLICAPDGTIRSTSAAMVRLLGWDREGLLGAPLTNIVTDVDRATVEACFTMDAHRHVVDARLIDPTGRRYPFRLEISDLCDDPAVAGFVIFAHDITDLRSVLDDLERIAASDPLTGLANRQALMDELRDRLERPAGKVAVLFCDLDGFKAVNDLHGHSRGDEVLRQVADALRSAVRPGDLVARLGGDEFVVVCDVTSGDSVEQLTDRVERAVMACRWRTEAVEASLGVSVGSVIATAGTMTAEDVLAEADSEMYRVKAWRHGLEVLPATVSERRRLAVELTAGFAAGEIVTHFQPVVRIPEGRVVGFEGLARWKHPERGLLGPSEFMAVCEEAGLGGELARVTIRDAVSLLAATSQGAVSVNLSPLQLADPSITQLLIDELTATGVTPSRLAVEVTERSVLERIARDGRSVLEVLADIRDAGVRVVVDDFGTGSASLARLVQVPASALKIDRSFTLNLASDDVAAALVRAITTLAADLGLLVIAEGVESSEQATALFALGCRYVQGYRFGDAVEAAAAVGLVGTTLAASDEVAAATTH